MRVALFSEDSLALICAVERGKTSWCHDITSVSQGVINIAARAAALDLPQVGPAFIQAALAATAQKASSTPAGRGVRDN